MKENAAIAALDAYLDGSHHVPHALLLHGPWGAGKTTFLKEIYFKEHRKGAAGPETPGTVNPLKPIWVSFFGLTGVTDLQRRIREEISPVGTRLATIAGIGIDLAAGYLQAGDAARTVKEQAKQLLDPKLLVDRVFVFDDVERAEADLIPLLGLVNQIVEIHGGRVILIANEAELRSRDDAEWDRRAEKLVGRRVIVDPNVDAVMHRFLSIRRDNTQVQHYLEAAAETVRAVFQTSQTGNLRILTWALDAVEKIIRTMANTSISSDVVHRVAAQTSATVIELRVGNIQGSDLENLEQLHLELALRDINKRKVDATVHRTEAELAADRWQAFEQKYKNFHLGMPAIEYGTIVTLERSGYVEVREIEKALGDRFGVGRNGPPPAWRRLWYLPYLSIGGIEAAIAELTQDLARSHYTNVGEILHAAGIAVDLANQGEMRPTSEQPAEHFFKEYLDRLYSENELDFSAFEEDETSGHPFHHPHSSLEYRARGTEAFRSIFTHAQNIFVKERLKQANVEADSVIKAAEGGDLQPWRTAVKLVSKPEPSALDRAPGFLAVDPDRIAHIVTEHSGGPVEPLRCILARHDTASKRELLKPELEWVNDAVAHVLVRLTTSRSIAGIILAKSVREMIVSHNSEYSPDRRIRLE